MIAGKPHCSASNEHIGLKASCFQGSPFPKGVLKLQRIPRISKGMTHLPGSFATGVELTFFCIILQHENGYPY